ncbi:MAG: hypothetical protein H7Z10_12870 [Gemmatimonadaceae bacterium]|nr:hypothetical protein [Acetobacteraceae bacterium]
MSYLYHAVAALGEISETAYDRRAWAAHMADDTTDLSDTDLAADWITIWQSEWAALVADREVQDAWQRTIAAWAGQAMLAVRAQEAIDAAARRARAVSPPGPTPAADAFDARDRVIADLLARVAELERRAAGSAAA